MKSDIAKRSRKAGMPPETLIHVGKKRADKAKVSVIEYDRKWYSARGLTSPDMPLESSRKAAIRWIDVEGLDQVDLITRIGKRYSIHPLVLEDILQTGQRPKLEDNDSHLFVVLKMLQYDAKTQKVESEQVSIVLFRSVLLTFQEGITGDVFDSIRNRVQGTSGQLRSLGSDYLMYCLMDAIVDQYFVILEQLGDRIELAEESILKDPSRETLQEIQRLKHELMFVRKSVWSLREVVAQLERGDSKLVRKSTLAYFRDLYDHVITTIETLESYRETLSGLVDLAMSTMSNRMNEVMKTLTVIATIFIPLTFIAGVYGMNFDLSASPWNMPELHWWFGYPAVLFIMGAIAVLMLFYFRRKSWF